MERGPRAHRRTGKPKPRPRRSPRRRRSRQGLGDRARRPREPTRAGLPAGRGRREGRRSRRSRLPAPPPRRDGRRPRVLRGRDPGSRPDPDRDSRGADRPVSRAQASRGGFGALPCRQSGGHLRAPPRSRRVPHLVVLREHPFPDRIHVRGGPAGNPQRWWEQGIHADDLQRVVAANQAVLDEGHAMVEFRFRRKDGIWIWLHDEKRVLFDPENRPSEVVGSWMDVTARVRLEEQLRQSQKMEAIGQLAGGVAHDFNNLLTVISGNTDLLLSDMPTDDPRRAALADVRAAGERAANLTRQLLAFSRKQILEPKLVDVHEVVSGIEKMLRRLIGEDVELLTDLAADPSWVKVDPGQLEQVVMNLAMNARGIASRGGRLTIRTRNVDPKEPVDLEETAGRQLRPKVAISISDAGIGISPEVKAHLFEPFFTTKGVGKGTGLGFALD